MHQGNCNNIVVLAAATAAVVVVVVAPAVVVAAAVVVVVAAVAAAPAVVVVTARCNNERSINLVTIGKIVDEIMFLTSRMFTSPAGVSQTQYTKHVCVGSRNLQHGCG